MSLWSLRKSVVNKVSQLLVLINEHQLAATKSTRRERIWNMFIFIRRINNHTYDFSSMKCDVDLAALSALSSLLWQSKQSQVISIDKPINVKSSKVAANVHTTEHRRLNLRRLCYRVILVIRRGWKTYAETVIACGESARTMFPIPDTCTAHFK